MPKMFWKFGEVCRVYDLFLEERENNRGNPSGFDFSNVMVVRYEDVLKNRTLWANKIYDFVGLKMHKRVERDLLEIVGKYNKGVADEYSTKWLSRLEWRTIEKIESSCGRMFESYGYKQIGTNEEFLRLKKLFKSEKFDEIQCVQKFVTGFEIWSFLRFLE